MVAGAGTWRQLPGPHRLPGVAKWEAGLSGAGFLPRFRRRRLDKARQRKEEKAADRLEQELLRDTVKFGEVALQPPKLTAKPKTSVSRGRPDKKSLMLGMLLSPGSVSQPPATSLARQRIVAEERERVVQAYRALKKLQQRPLGAQ